MRPSLKHPTIKLRLTDSVTDVEDAIAIASLFRAIVRHLVRCPEVHSSFCPVTRAFAEENRWRAQRYGTDVDGESREAKPFTQVLADTLEPDAQDVEALGLTSEMDHLRRIVRRGTSAHGQIELYRALLKAGRRRDVAVRDLASG